MYCTLCAIQSVCNAYLLNKVNVNVLYTMYKMYVNVLCLPTIQNVYMYLLH